MNTINYGHFLESVENYSFLYYSLEIECLLLYNMTCKGMKRHENLKKANLQQFSAWLRCELLLRRGRGPSYSWVLKFIDARLEKTGKGALLLYPSIALILELIYNRIPRVRINREKTMTLIHYLSFLISIRNDTFVDKEILDIHLSPCVEDFEKWIKSHIGCTSPTYKQWCQSCVWQQDAMYAETTIRNFIVNEPVVGLSFDDKEIWPVYLAYLSSLAIEVLINSVNVPEELETQRAFHLSPEEELVVEENCKAFEDWLSRKNSSQTCKKYLSLLRGVNSTAESQLLCSFLKEQSVDNVLVVLNALVERGILERSSRKVAALYLSYQTQRAATEGCTIASTTKTIKFSKIDFENWLVLFVGLGRGYVKSFIEKAEEISEHLSPLGFSLYTVNSPFELKALEPIFLSAISDSHVLTLDYYYSYMRSSLFGIEEIKVVDDRREETKIVQKTSPSFGEWCLERGLGAPTIKTMQAFLVTLSRYCKSLNLDFNPKRNSDIVNVRALLDLYTNQQGYRKILTVGGAKNYVDRYCSYLLNRITCREIEPFLSQNGDQGHLPILVVADKKQVGAKFSTWLKAGRFCDENSARTFVSSLYAAEDLVREQFGDSLLENPCKRKIAYLRLLVLENKRFKKNWNGPLRLFLQFISEFRLIANEEHLENIKYIKNIIITLFNGVVRLSPISDYQRLIDVLNSPKYQHLQYSEDDIMRMVKRIAVHDKQSDTLIIQEKFLSSEETAQLLQYIQGIFESGCPVVDYNELRKKLPENKQFFHNDTLRQFLTMVGEGIFVCEARCIRSVDSCKENVSFPTIISEKLREIKKPISKNELIKLLPSVSEEIITRILGQNNLGNNIGIVNPKREKIFHADIIELTKTEKSYIISNIIKALHSNYFITSSQLYKQLKNKVPKLFKRYPFLTKSALFRVLRYKLRDFFKFSISCITFSSKVDILSIYKSYCAKHNRIKMSQLLQFEKELGVSNIPFDQIYETHARVNRDNLIRREQLCFDIPIIDSILQGICQKTLLPISRFNAYDKLPLVSGFEWTPFLLEHYLTYHSCQFSLYKRNFSRRGCYGLIIQRETDILDFDEAVARYVWLSGTKLDGDSILTHLYESGVIGVRKYANIDQIIQRVIQLQNMI